MFNKAKKILICLINTTNWRVTFDKPYKNGDIFKYNQKKASNVYLYSRVAYIIIEILLSLSRFFILPNSHS